MGKTKYDSVDTENVFNNTNQNLIRITEDKLENILTKHFISMEKKRRMENTFRNRRFYCFSFDIDSISRCILFNSCCLESYFYYFFGDILNLAHL